MWRLGSKRDCTENEHSENPGGKLQGFLGHFLVIPKTTFLHVPVESKASQDSIFRGIRLYLTLGGILKNLQPYLE